MKAASAGAVAAGLGTSMMGSASAAGINLPPLARDGNKIVDPSGNEVILRGVSIADPGEQSRDWRGQTAPETFELATNPDEGWYNRIIRVPIQAEFIAAGTTAPSEDDMPHGDDWGPLLPGEYDASDLEWYLETYIDELVELGREQGAYVMIDYHRHYPVFHQEDHQNHGVDGDTWVCSSDGGEDWRYPEVCGERGVLWHGEDQVDDILNLAEEQNVLEAFELDQDDLYTEPPEVSNALDDELTTFWEVTADRYADDMHVVFDVYNEPTGPYGGDWGAPDRQPHELSGDIGDIPGDVDDADYQVSACEMKAWYDLWVDRAQPWVDIVENQAPGHLVTIGNPRWSQYTYWAPYNEFEAENMCYTGHVYTQDDLRPLDEYFGEPSEQVPVFFSEFGWIDHETLVPTPWMDGSRDEYGPEFEDFMESYDVHPICWNFDHTWEPNFFDHGEPGEADGAPSADDWMDHLLDTTPGQFWHEYVQEKEGDRDQPADGSTQYDGDSGPNSLHIGPGAVEDCDTDDDGDNETPGDPQDTTGDGLYNDIDGNGDTTASDVTEFFDGFTDDYSDPQYYDFDGNGDVTTSDVVELFNSL